MRFGILTETGVRRVGLKDQTANLAQDSLGLFVRRLCSEGQKEEERYARPTNDAEEVLKTTWKLETLGFSAEWSLYRDYSNSLSLRAETPSTRLGLAANFRSPKSERPAEFPRGYSLNKFEISCSQKRENRAVGSLTQSASFSTNGAGRCVNGVQRVLMIHPCPATEALMAGVRNFYHGSPHFTLHATDTPSGRASTESKLKVSSEGIHWHFLGPETPKLFQMLWRSVEKEDDRLLRTTVRMLQNCVL